LTDRNRLVALAAALLLAGCATGPSQYPATPVAAGPEVTVQATPVRLNPSDPAQDRLGNFVYAGGVALSSVQTTRFHGLSDLDVQPNGAVVAVGDDGDLLHARVLLDAAGRLIGLADARLTGLNGLDGQPLQGKTETDAEGLALLPNGDLLISFERNHRIWLYPAAGGAPRAVNMPDTSFPLNEGMEALAPDPARGPGAYIVGGEDTGLTWSCSLAAPCVEGPRVALGDKGANLVAARRLPQGRTAWLLRAFSPLTGAVITLRITERNGGLIDEQVLRAPLTSDNFEGLAAVPGKAGGIRFYLISDDNFSSLQRTMLLAFDWVAPKGQ